MATFHVQRILLLDGQEVDCASEPGRCTIGMGLISDYDRSGGTPVDFDPSAPLAPAPTVELDRTAGIVDRDTVPVRATGLHPGSVLFVQLCESATERYTGIGELQIGADGTVDGAIRLIDPGPFAPGDEVRVEVRGASPHTVAEATLCSPDGEWCSDSGGVPVASDGTATFEVRIDHGTPARTAILAVHLFHNRAPGSGLPPLFPPPITIEVRN